MSSGLVVDRLIDNDPTLGLVNNILPFSSVDGPGNRSVVFFQGCNLSCVYCHNPYTIGLCTHCGDCIEPCPEDALAWKDSKVVVDWSRCTRCAVCIDVCPESSTPLAETLSAAELVDRLRPSAPFVSGVTVSGGEATTQQAFLEAFCRAVKEDPSFAGKTVLIDSNGVAPLELWDRLAPWIDGVMLDMKAWTPLAHEQLTGSANDAVFASAMHLAALGLLTEIRFVVVPGVNDSAESVGAMATWAANMGASVKVIGVRHHGVANPTFEQADPAHTDRIAAEFSSRGVPTIAI